MGQSAPQIDTTFESVFAPSWRNILHDSKFRKDVFGLKGCNAVDEMVAIILRRCVIERINAHSRHTTFCISFGSQIVDGQLFLNRLRRVQPAIVHYAVLERPWYAIHLTALVTTLHIKNGDWERFIPDYSDEEKKAYEINILRRVFCGPHHEVLYNAEDDSYSFNRLYKPRRTMTGFEDITISCQST